MPNIAEFYKKIKVLEANLPLLRTPFFHPSFQGVAGMSTFTGIHQKGAKLRPPFAALAQIPDLS